MDASVVEDGTAKFGPPCSGTGFLQAGRPSCHPVNSIKAHNHSEQYNFKPLQAITLLSFLFLHSYFHVHQTHAYRMYFILSNDINTIPLLTLKTSSAKIY